MTEQSFLFDIKYLTHFNLLQLSKAEERQKRLTNKWTDSDSMHETRGVNLPSRGI